MKKILLTSLIIATLISCGNNKIDKKLIDNSILNFVQEDQLFMHYFDANLEKNESNPVWRNQGIYFWSKNEKFEKKSLPDNFLKLKTKFLTLNINSIKGDIQLSKGEVAPWFGKPGGGEKLFFLKNGQEISIEEAFDLNAIIYLEKTSLNSKNIAILQDKENYIFITKQGITFDKSTPLLDGKETTLSDLYAKNKLSIYRKK